MLVKFGRWKILRVLRAAIVSQPEPRRWLLPSTKNLEQYPYRQLGSFKRNHSWSSTSTVVWGKPCSWSEPRKLWHCYRKSENPTDWSELLVHTIYSRLTILLQLSAFSMRNVPQLRQYYYLLSYTKPMVILNSCGTAALKTLSAFHT